MEENFKKTCLYDAHVALGAKMSPFAGFIMPIQYSDITAEHNAVRGSVGMFDVSHMGEVFVTGPDAEKFVSRIFTNDISGMPQGKILYGMMCYPDGGVVDDLLVYREFTPEPSYLLVINAANIGKDVEWMSRNAEGFDVKVDNQSEAWGQIAVQGPSSEEAVRKVTGLDVSSLVFYTYGNFTLDGERVIVSRTGYTGEDGFELYASPALTVKLWDRFLKAGVTPCGLGCRDTLRFEAGLPLYGDELSPEITPIQAGLGMFCKLDHDFIGRDALAKEKQDGPARKLVGIEIHDRAIPRATYPVEKPDGTPVGTVTTGYHSISLDKSICFALVDSSVSALGTPLCIRIRKKVFPGEVVGKRFYKTNYKK